jgi:hypothetical protein
LPKTFLVSVNRRLWPIAVGAAGLGMLAGHQLDYFVSDRTLGNVSHAHLGGVLAAALIGAITATVVLAAGSITQARQRRSESLSILGLGKRLALLQSVGFILMETLEQISSGSSMHLPSLRLLASGVAVQILIAFIAAIIIKLLGRVAYELATRAITRRVPLDAAASSVVAFLDPAHLRGIESLTRAAPRAPPVTSLN